MNLVDTSGWIEYFSGGSNAGNFAEQIENTEDLLVSTINIYEVFKKICLKYDDSKAFHAIMIMKQGKVVDVTESISLLAVTLGIKYNLGMADSLILASSVEYSAILHTQDSDFINIPNVVYHQK